MWSFVSGFFTWHSFKLHPWYSTYRYYTPLYGWIINVLSHPFITDICDYLFQFGIRMLWTFTHFWTSFQLRIWYIYLHTYVWKTITTKGFLVTLCNLSLLTYNVVRDLVLSPETRLQFKKLNHKLCILFMWFSFSTIIFK